MLVAANWKMFKTRAETRAFCDAFRPPEGVDVVVCPPFTSLDVAVASGLTVYAQNVHWAREGAFTGEVSAPMLLDLGVAGAIVGHSERRQYFGETDETVNGKIKAVFKVEMTPILCVGETLEERDAGRCHDKVEGQVRAALAGIGADHANGLVIAYEPIWAIGTGRNAEPADAGEVAGVIRHALGDLYSSEVAQAVRVQYGGSVKAGNIREFMAHPEVDGALVGGASLDPEEFALIVKYR